MYVHEPWAVHLVSFQLHSCTSSVSARLICSFIQTPPSASAGRTSAKVLLTISTNLSLNTVPEPTVSYKRMFTQIRSHWRMVVLKDNLEERIIFKCSFFDMSHLLYSYFKNYNLFMKDVLKCHSFKTYISSVFSWPFQPTSFSLQHILAAASKKLLQVLNSIMWKKNLAGLTFIPSDRSTVLE